MYLLNWNIRTHNLQKKITLEICFSLCNNITNRIPSNNLYAYSKATTAIKIAKKYCHLRNV